MLTLKNPYLNAFLAALYIATLVSVVFTVGQMERFQNGPETILAPMLFLSVFVLSAALMGLLFVYTPARMFLDNQKEEALIFFFKTVGTFACFVALFGILTFVIPR